MRNMLTQKGMIIVKMNCPMNRIQDDVDICIRKYLSNFTRIQKEISVHGIPIRMFHNSNSTVWRFNDGYELEIAEFGYIN